VGAGAFSQAGEWVASGARRLGDSFQALAGMPKAIGTRMESGRMARGLEDKATQARQIANKPAPAKPQATPTAKPQVTAPAKPTAPPAQQAPVAQAPVLGQRKAPEGALQVTPKPEGPAPRTSAAPGAKLQHRADVGRQMANEELTHQAWQAAPAAATLAVGTAGTGYALSPSNTAQNRTRRASDRYLGTNFGQQSRAGAFFGS
jgi:hypothetical protein